jgi:hypothetical protein
VKKFLEKGRKFGFGTLIAQLPHPIEIEISTSFGEFMKLNSVATSVFLTGALFLGCASQANAVTITLQTVQDIIAPANNPYTVTRTTNGFTRSLPASGHFHTTANGFSFVGFCIEDTQALNLPAPYDVNPLATSDVRNAFFSKLYANWYSRALTDAATMNAFSLAVWEIANDASTNLSFTSGAFTVQSYGGQAVADLASTILADVKNTTAGFTNAWSFRIWTSPTSQDVIEGNVPVPATGLLLLGGLAAAALRRKI